MDPARTDGGVNPILICLPLCSKAKWTWQMWNVSNWNIRISNDERWFTAKNVMMTVPHIPYPIWQIEGRGIDNHGTYHAPYTDERLISESSHWTMWSQDVQTWRGDRDLLEHLGPWLGGTWRYVLYVLYRLWRYFASSGNIHTGKPFWLFKSARNTITPVRSAETCGIRVTVLFPFLMQCVLTM